MFSFLKRKQVSQYIGLEIRPDGMALAFSGQDGPVLEFVSCNAAERQAQLSAWTQQYALDGASVRAVLPFEQYKNYVLERPDVEESELSEAARWRVKDMLDFEVSDAVLDVCEFPNDALRGKPPQINVIVARKAIVQNVVDLVIEAGLELASIDVGDLALRNVMLQHVESPDQTIALMYLRRGKGIMNFVKNGNMYLARHFEFSLEALNDVTQQDQVIQYLSLEIQRSFDYFESQLGQIPPQHLLLYGPDPNIPLANMLSGGITAQIKALDLSRLGVNEGLDTINSLLAFGALLREEEA